jgi:lipoyl(octanoyl) transferase
MNREIFFQDLGTQPYKAVWDYQEKLLQENVQKKTVIRNQQSALSNVHLATSDPTIDTNTKPINNPSTINHLLFVEHSPVYTLGKNGNENNVLIAEQKRIEKGIEYFHINRGGDITFHGPGQIVGYPIFDLDNFKTDLGWYLRSLEEVMILTLAEYGLQGERSKGETGVWLDTTLPGKARKICALGIRCSRWITMHGFALNVNTDLDYFNFIIPCGIQNKKVTSLKNELGYEVNMKEVKDKLKRNFEKVFNAQMVYNLRSRTEEAASYQP